MGGLCYPCIIAQKRGGCHPSPSTFFFLEPFLVAFGENERITLPMKADFIERIPNPTVITLGGASHFVQEEVGPELAKIISDFIQGKPVVDLPAKN